LSAEAVKAERLTAGSRLMAREGGCVASERVTDVLRLCEEALARDSAERAAYLDTACGADAALRREIEALLAER